MRRRDLIELTALIGLILAPAGAAAHHGWGSYDAGKALTLEGKIIESTYQNPHGTLRFESAGKAWLVILAPPFRMQNRGLPAEKLAPGTTATVVGYAHRNDPNELRAERIMIDGRTVELR